MQIFGKNLILIGIFLVVIGFMFLVFGKLPWVGKLPGDIFVRKEDITFYFPITTCILISGILSLVFYLFNKK